MGYSFKTDYSDHYYLMIITRNTKFINKRDFSFNIIQIFEMLLITITGKYYRLIAFKIHFLIFKTYSLYVSLIIFQLKSLKLSTTTGYNTSQLDYATQSTINISLD